MLVESPLPQSDPCLIAWGEYTQTDEFQNSRKWAAHQEHFNGSLWTVFYQGWKYAQADALAAIARLEGELKRPLMYPIMDGPSVPWEVMVPHNNQALINHDGQGLGRLAERGGLGMAEAWYVVNDFKCPHLTGYSEAERNWKEFAATTNERYAVLAQQNANLLSENTELKRVADNLLKMIEKYIQGRPDDLVIAMRDYNQLTTI